MLKKPFFVLKVTSSMKINPDVTFTEQRASIDLSLMSTLGSAPSYITTTTTNVTTTNVTDDAGNDGVNWTLVESQPFTDFVEYRVARWVLLVYQPICAGVGIIGNIMCMVVVIATSLRHSPTVVYMVTLAFLDWCISVLGVVNFLSSEVFFGEEQIFRETWHCKTFYFFMLFIIHFDTLTMVFMTAQRYVAVGFPLHASRWVTKPMAAASLVVAAVISALANVIHLITLEIQSFDGSHRGRCSKGTGLGQFIQVWVYPWIDFVLYFLMPSICISIFNILMFRTLKKAERFKQNAVSTKSSVRVATVSSVPVQQTCVHGPGVPCPAMSSCVKNNNSSTHNVIPDQMKEKKTSRSLNKSIRATSFCTPKVGDINHSASTSNITQNRSAVVSKNSAMLTRMLMVVSLAYLVLTFPIGVFVVISRFWNPSEGYDKARFTLARDITESLMFTNHSINFLLYCLSRKGFRHKAVRVLLPVCVLPPKVVGSKPPGSNPAFTSSVTS